MPFSPESVLAHYEVLFNCEDKTAKDKPKYPNNFIKTSKYTIWTFLPLNLFNQVRLCFIGNV